MIKKKTEDVEEAEIISSDKVKTENMGSYNVKFQIIILYAVCFGIIITGSGLLIYNEAKFSSKIVEIKKQIKSISPVVSLEIIENKLNNFKVLEKSESINRINSALKIIENKFDQKLASLPTSFDTNESINIVKNEVLKLESQLLKEIANLKNLSSEKAEAGFVEDGDIQKKLAMLELIFEDKIEILFTRVQQLERELSDTNSKLIELKTLSLAGTEKTTEIDILSFNLLEESFKELAFQALQLEAQQNIGGSPLAIVTSTLKSLFIFRSTTPRTGVGTDAILSRAEHELIKGNFAGCLKELALLEDDLENLFFDWKNNLNKLINKNN